MIIAVSCVVAALVVIIGIVVGVVLNNKNKNSFQYNYDKGMGSYQNKDYDNAIKYLAKASKLSEGKKNVDLKYTLYQCYAATDNTDMSIITTDITLLPVGIVNGSEYSSEFLVGVEPSNV